MLNSPIHTRVGSTQFSVIFHANYKFTNLYFTNFVDKVFIYQTKSDLFLFSVFSLMGKN